MINATEYHPLDGEELLDYILRDMRAKLAGGKFSKHLAYHNPSYTALVEVRCFEAESTAPVVAPGAKKYEDAISIEIDGRKVTGDIGGKPVKIIADTRSGPVLEPDRIREQHGLGTYKIATKDGVLVHEKEKP